MKKYKLAKSICITALDDAGEEDIPAKYRTGFFVLTNERRNREYLINGTIKYFIDKFSTPKTREEAIAEVAADVDTGLENVEATCSSFIDYLRRRKVLLPEDETETEVHDETEEAFYKEGDRINGYIVTSLLDSKDDIDIYIAADEVYDRECVIKLLNQKKIPDREEFEEEGILLEREYEHLQKANDIPSVNKAYAFEKDGHGNTYIVLEFIRGKSISKFVKEATALTREDYLLLIQNMLEAFARLHHSGTLHADIHSSNVLVTEDKVVRIIDLGMSLKKEELSGDQVLKHGGAHYYMPPERINISSVHKYSNPPDFYSDVYQIGLLMYSVLYHNLPFDGFVWEDLATAIKEEDPVLPDMAVAGFAVPQSLKNIITKCLEKNPEKRYPDAAEILEQYTYYMFKERSFQLTNA